MKLFVLPCGKFFFGQEVWGIVCGHFMVTGSKTVDGSTIIKLREIGPKGEVSDSEMFLREDCLQATNPKA